MTSKLSKNYIDVLKGLKEKIRQARLRAAIAVNSELLKLYWEIGNTILLQQKQEGWGTKVIDRLAADLKTAFPDMKGLSKRNIKYMRAFAEAWPHFTPPPLPVPQLQSIDNNISVIVQATPAQLRPNEAIDNTNPLVQASLAQISWYHHTTLLDKVKEPELRVFLHTKNNRKRLEQGFNGTPD